jgi:hypothetical protein
VSFILDVQLHCRACQTIIVAFCLCNGVALASQKKFGYWYTKAPTFGENNDLLANLQTNTLHVNWVQEPTLTYIHLHYPGNMNVTAKPSLRPAMSMLHTQGMSKQSGGKCSDTFAGDLRRRQVSIDITHRSILSGYPKASNPTPILAVLSSGLFWRQHYDLPPRCRLDATISAWSMGDLNRELPGAPFAAIAGSTEVQRVRRLTLHACIAGHTAELNRVILSTWEEFSGIA